MLGVASWRMPKCFNGEALCPVDQWKGSRANHENDNNEGRLWPESNAGYGGILWTRANRERGYCESAIYTRTIPRADINGIAQRRPGQKRARTKRRTYAGKTSCPDYNGSGYSCPRRLHPTNGMLA